MQPGEEFRPLTNKHDVRRRLHHLAGDFDRMRIMLDRSNRARRQRAAIHDTCIEFDLAKNIWNTADTNALVSDVGFNFLDRCHCCIKGTPSSAQDCNRCGKTNTRIPATNDNSAHVIHDSLAFPLLNLFPSTTAHRQCTGSVREPGSQR